MEQQRLVISYQEMTELQVDFRNLYRNAVHVGRNFGCTWHPSSYGFGLTRKVWVSPIKRSCRILTDGPIGFAESNRDSGLVPSNRVKSTRCLLSRAGKSETGPPA